MEKAGSKTISQVGIDRIVVCSKRINCKLGCGRADKQQFSSHFWRALYITDLDNTGSLIRRQK